MRQINFIRKISGFLLLAIYVSGSFSALAQTKRAAANQSAANAKSCNSGYSGTVSYTKTVQTSSTGRHGSNTAMKRVYQANIVIRDTGMSQGTATVSPDGSGVTGSYNFRGQATASVTENDNRLDVSEKDDFCKLTLKGGQDKRRVRCENKYNRQTQASGTGEATVFVGLRGNNLKLSLGNLPQLAGTTNTDSSTNCSGTCSPFKPIGSNSSVEINNAGERNASTNENVITFNPQSFNRLSGSWSKTEPTPGGTVTENYTWNLSRCAPPLEIADLTFEHKRVPNPNQWIGIDPLSGTTDGNLVRIKAKVFNNGGDTAYANVKFTETKSGEPLPDGTVSVAVKPGEFREVEYEWDTSGYAWNDAQKAETTREIKAEIEGDAETAKIKILPKPVILVHGLWSNAGAWAEYPSYLREAHSFAWEGYAVGADPYVAKMDTGDHPGNYKKTNTVFENAQQLGKQIKWVREQKNAWHVDVVAHSMGGLISRQYINAFMAPVFDNKPEITHLVMLGTPNMGSPCADLVGGVFEFFEQNDMNAMRELRPSVVADFNSRTTNRKGVKFSILIGYAIPQTCQTDVRGDGVVPIMSARYNIADRDYAFRDHLTLTDDTNFKSFVLPRLAIGPKKAQQEKSTAQTENRANENYARQRFQTNGANTYESGNYFRSASYARENDAPASAQNADEQTAENLTVRKKIELGAKQTQEIEIPAEAGKNNGVVIVAPTSVVATLTNSSGQILGKSEGGLEVLKNPFRAIGAGRNVSGAMKLKLENFGNEPVTIFVAGYAGDSSDANLTIEAGKTKPTGQIPLTAKWMTSGAPVLNAKIIGKIGGAGQEIQFFDDGKHGDKLPGDGIYGAETEKLPKGEFYIEAIAEADAGRKAFTVAQIKNGAPAAAPPAKPAARRTK